MRNNQPPEPETDYLKRRYEELGRPGLTAWGMIAKTYWRENLPGLYRGLKASGVLLEAVVIAQENAKDRYSDLVSNQGVDPWAARYGARSRRSIGGKTYPVSTAG